MKLASRQKKSYQEARATNTVLEFFDWIAYWEWEQTEEFHRIDHLFAKLIAELHRVNAKDKQAAERIEDKMFLPKFRIAMGGTDPNYNPIAGGTGEELTEEEYQRRLKAAAEHSKNMWMGPLRAMWERRNEIQKPKQEAKRPGWKES